MIESLFNLFNSVLVELPNTEFFIGLIASACLFAIGCLIKFLIID